MPATQMNMRIDSSLKTTGDLSIRESGSTPTKMVHAVWEYAARNRHKPKAMRDLMDFLASGSSVDATDAKADSPNAIEEQIMRGPKLVEEYLASLGISPETVPTVTYDEARAAAFADEWNEMMPR